MRLIGHRSDCSVKSSLTLVRVCCSWNISFFPPIWSCLDPGPSPATPPLGSAPPPPQWQSARYDLFSIRRIGIWAFQLPKKMSYSSHLYIYSRIKKPALVVCIVRCINILSIYMLFGVFFIHPIYPHKKLKLVCRDVCEILLRSRTACAFAAGLSPDSGCHSWLLSTCGCVWRMAVQRRLLCSRTEQLQLPALEVNVHGMLHTVVIFLQRLLWFGLP